jgi:hypothetical protein
LDGSWGRRGKWDKGHSFLELGIAMVMMDRAGELSRRKFGCGTDWLRPLGRIVTVEDLATASNEKNQVAAMFDVCCG